MKNIAVVLGNRINDDGTLTKTMYTRLELALELDKEFNPDYIVVSGGIANPAVNFSEAQAMYDYLVAHGINKDKIIKEDKSGSTRGNAIFTWKILENYEFDNLIICSTHIQFIDKGVIQKFYEAAQENEVISKKNFHIMIYTNSKPYL